MLVTFLLSCLSSNWKAYMVLSLIFVHNHHDRATNRAGLVFGLSGLYRFNQLDYEIKNINLDYDEILRCQIGQKSTRKS